MNRRVSWSEELIEPVVLHEPPAEHRRPVRPLEDAASLLEAASPNAEEPAVPEKAAPEGGSESAAAGDELERRHNSEPLDSGPPAGVPSGCRFSPNVTVLAGSAIFVVFMTISMLALRLVGTTSAEARLRATTEGLAHGDGGKYMSAAKTSRKAATTVTSDDDLTNATTAPEGPLDKRTADAPNLTHSNGEGVTVRRRDSRNHRNRLRDGHHSSSVRGRGASECRYSVTTTLTYM
ncbi:hypothetical protein MRX96_029020 [Rhipicephalus microplus]